MNDTNRESSKSTDDATPRRGSRRRFLAAVGASTSGILLAGCGGAGTETGTGNETGTGGGTEPATATEAGTETSETDAEESETDSEESETDSTETASENAQLRVAHMSPNAPNVDVYVDDEVVLEDVPFGAVSDYLSVPGGTYTVKITPTGDAETVVFEGDVTVESEQAYTVAAIGEVGDEGDQAFEPLVLTDDNEPPDGETARVRAVHVSPDGPTVDITAGETVLFDGVSYGESGTTEVPAGDYTVEIRADTETNDGDVVASFDVTLEGGQVYTAFAAGYVTPDDEPASTPFDLVVSQDTETMSG